MDSFKEEARQGRAASGRILEIQRMSTEDGPGLRTTVFFKGCSLACAWCHNPESINFAPELVWAQAGCIGCGLCRETCGQGALEPGPAGLEINRDACIACGECALQCPTRSLTLLGEVWQADALLKALLKDRAYFETSGGGVTLSGGEAALQPDLAGPLLKGLCREGIHTALDTCGMVSAKILGRLLPHTRLLLFDIKEMDPARHRTFTGADNAPILKTLCHLAGQLESTGTDLWIRTPVIPGATDRPENIEMIAGFILNHLGKTVSRWELCAFNPLGRDKYARLGKSWAYEGCGPLAEEQIAALQKTAVRAGISREIVHYTGMLETEKEKS